MKTKLQLPAVLVLVLITAVLYFIPNQNHKPQRALASVGNFRCTVAQFLLDGVDSTRQIAPLFENLGNHHFVISGASEKAQEFYDQGLTLTYGFNHAEAHRSFMEASRLSPKSAMTYWGQAYALGPNINDPLPDEARKQNAWKAVSKANELASEATPMEQALIHALMQRYSADMEADQQELNQKYLKAMREVAKKFPQNADVQTLFAAAAMNTMPWNYWDKENQPQLETPAAKQALESAIKLNPKHPGAHHYYIHMMELPFPNEAVPSAEALETLVPAAGHLVHMPSHIYIRVGRYQDAVKLNKSAIYADEDYISQCFAQGLYPLAYYPHNIHFLWSSASFLGNSQLAIEAAKKTAEKVPVGEMKDLPFLQDFASTPLLSYVRFGKWNEILTVPKPAASHQYLNMIRTYARGIAFVRKGNLEQAREELLELEQYIANPEFETLIASGQNPAKFIAEVAHGLVAGEIAKQEGNYAEARRLMEKAVAVEDQLNYTEPSSWHIPPRHNLGALLLEMGEYQAAEKIYREDLLELPNNGWSLKGLYKSLRAQGKGREAKKTATAFKKAWSEADISIETSIL